MTSDWEQLIQLGFVSDDIHAAILDLTRTLNAGPMSLAVAMGYVSGGSFSTKSSSNSTIFG